MTEIIQTEGLTRHFGKNVALDGVDLSVHAGDVVGLIGRNGSGKTTLFDHVVGLLLPTSGRCSTFGVEASRLSSEELGRIGVVHQTSRLLGWMSVQQQLRYVEAFHPRWDLERESLLMRELELDRKAKIRELSPGNVQKVALVLAVCSRPALLLLDEPLSSIDPIAREKLLAYLLELVREDGTTVVIASHVLRDVERIVNRIVCLERGKVCNDSGLDELLEDFDEWELASKNGALPDRFEESFILRQEVSGSRGRLVVRNAEGERESFATRHHLEIQTRPMNLEAIFPLLVGQGVER